MLTTVNVNVLFPKCSCDYTFVFIRYCAFRLLTYIFTVLYHRARLNSRHFQAVRKKICRENVYLYFAFWFSFLERCNGRTRREKERKKHVSSKKKLSALLPLMRIGRLRAVHSPCLAYFLFYQARSREDYRHRGITILKLRQLGGDLQPVMES